MSYIVPMNKPVCQNCYFRVGRYCGIIESTEQIPVKKNRCPLIEVPPHGRLIDADKLDIHDISPVDGFCVMGITEEDICLVDTVIEAEDKAQGGDDVDRDM